MTLADPEKTIDTQTLRLEPIVLSHAAELYSSLQDPALYTYIPLEPPKSIQALEARYSRWTTRGAPDGSEIWLNYAVFSRHLKKYVGTLQATIQKEGKTYIAYEVFPPFWRQGIAKEACGALIALLFGSYGIQLITAHLDTRNTASWKLLESLGFTRLRIIKNADEFKGTPSDEYVYELAQADWFQRN
jgi:ribosomal-protein-alanine N-acetyltransferase